MKKKGKIIGMLIVGIVAILLVTLSYINVINSENDFEYAIHKVSNGFGYTIKLNGKIMVKQDHIPAVYEHMPFCNSEDAQKVAEAVINKINKENVWGISREELIQLDINLNCN